MAAGTEEPQRDQRRHGEQATATLRRPPEQRDDSSATIAIMAVTSVDRESCSRA
jgi:hypothetical protein